MKHVKWVVALTTIATIVESCQFFLQHNKQLRVIAIKSLVLAQLSFQFLQVIVELSDDTTDPIKLAKVAVELAFEMPLALDVILSLVCTTLALTTLRTRS